MLDLEKVYGDFETIAEVNLGKNQELAIEIKNRATKTSKQTNKH